MRKSVLAAGAVLACILGLTMVTVTSEAQDAPKHTIKVVMQKAMKGGLCGKVASGKATDDEKKLLIELFEALHAHKPPRGDEASFKEKAKALLDGAKAAAEDSKKGGALKKAANCKACHEAHKG
jgi:hypothetical protein